MVDVANVYMHKNEGRLMAYIKETQQVVSYPRVIMENAIGRKLLPNEQVHHKDENPLNNNIDNLEILTVEEHRKLHAEEQRKYHDKTMKCPLCGKEFIWTAEQQSCFYRNSKRKRYTYQSIGLPFCSKSCAGKYGRSVQLDNSVNSASKLRKLTDEQVRYIRENYIPRDKEFSAKALSRKFDISYSTIKDIIKNKAYVDVQ